MTPGRPCPHSAVRGANAQDRSSPDDESSIWSSQCPKTHADTDHNEERDNETCPVRPSVARHRRDPFPVSTWTTDGDQRPLPANGDTGITGPVHDEEPRSYRFLQVFDLFSILGSRPPRAGSTKVIGIDGHGGSGKSTVASELSGRLGAGIVHTDDFASWENPKDWWPLLIEQIFEPLRSGARTLSYTRSQWWPGHEPEPVVNQPVTDVLIVEGVGSLRREFRRYLSVAILVVTPREVCMTRGISRDAAMGARELVLETWNRWFDDELGYMARDEPEKFADIVLDGTVPFGDQLISEGSR